MHSQLKSWEAEIVLSYMTTITEMTSFRREYIYNHRSAAASTRSLPRVVCLIRLAHPHTHKTPPRRLSHIHMDLCDHWFVWTYA